MEVQLCRVSSALDVQKNRKLRIEKIGKIRNFVLKNRRKIGKSIALSSTKIVSQHPIGYESSASTFVGLRSAFVA